MSGGSSRRYPPELRERAVRMVAEISGQHGSEWAAISEVARLLGVGCAETVRKWVRQVQVDAGSRRDDQRRVRRGEATAAGERRIAKGQRDFKDRISFLRGRTRPATALVTRFIAEHQGHRGPDGLRWGVESICTQLTKLGVPIAPSTYYDHINGQPSRRQVRDEGLKAQIAPVGSYSAPLMRTLYLYTQRPAWEAQ
jgi:transposase-like protein